MAAESSGGLFPVNIARVRESLDSLADDVEFIVSSKGDNLQDYDAWERRENAGRQFARLRAMLNNGDLHLADCDRATLRLLQSAWSSLKLLRYGNHHERPKEYCGPLFLPGEVGPLEERLPLRRAHDRYDRHEDLKRNISKDAVRASTAQLEQSAKGRKRSRLDELAHRALRAISKPHLTTKRARWSHWPDVLRQVSARLGQSTDDGPDTGRKPISVARRDSKTEARDKWIYRECLKGTPYKSIIAQLRRKPKTWERIESIPGIKRAAVAYARRHDLELPPARKRGRKPR